MQPHSNQLLKITPLGEQDCLYIVERTRSEFTCPIHTHKEYELNFIENGATMKRTVGDSIEVIGDYDLVLITDDRLQHGWQIEAQKSADIREITIQFSAETFPKELLKKNQFKSIQEMFEKGRLGLAFSLSSILRVKSLLNSLAHETHGFYSVINLFTLLYELSIATDSRVLASSSFVETDQNSNSRRIKKVVEFIELNYQHEIRIKEIAQLVNMAPEAFSRFFKQRTNKSFTDYLTDFRIGRVCRLLIDSTHTVSEICLACGFNNISNFNRIFKIKKQYSPSEYRDLYSKKQVIF